jgi:diguanylate cyclase (GGDEF)-like protein/PAS domain S-box-containing protein
LRVRAALDDAAIGFIGARDVPSAADVAVRAAVALASDRASWAAVLTTRSSGLQVIATAGAAPYVVGQSSGADQDAELGSAGQHDTWDRAGRWNAAVMADSKWWGHLVIGGPPEPSDSVGSALQAVITQLGLVIERVEATDEALARAERRFRSLTQNSSDAVTLHGPDGMVLYMSASGRSLLGREAESLLGDTFEALTHPDDSVHSREQFVKVVLGGPGTRVRYECRFLHADGSWRQVETTMTNLLSDPAVAAIVSNSRDITDRRELEAQLSHQAFHDSLTGLANRALFLDRVTHALDRADRASDPVAVMFIDIDDFKMVNDSLGHHLGDGVLVTVAERLKAATRPGDTVARLGGDEFAVLLESGEMPATAEAIAGRIAAALTLPIRIGAEDVTARASIGVALGQPPDGKPDALLRDADLAMYLAKRNGKNRFEMFHPTMHEDAVRRLETAADLRRGIEGRQLEVFYQPIIDVDTSVAFGVEALVRWHHPTRGLVTPAEFIPVAESTGMIVPLGRWVLAEACRQAQAWRAAGITKDAFYVSVNLSARQLQDPGLTGDVAAAIRDSGLPPERVVLEVTETIVMDDLETALARLVELKGLGLRLAIDDFGTGYSSLRYLRDLPVDVVKIDKSFVDRITLDPEGAAMVRGVIDLSSALGLTTIAEGVEHDDQLELLRQLGCDRVQGFLFAKPMPGEELATFLSRPSDHSLRHLLDRSQRAFG